MRALVKSCQMLELYKYKVLGAYIYSYFKNSKFSNWVRTPDLDIIGQILAKEKQNYCKKKKREVNLLQIAIVYVLKKLHFSRSVQTIMLLWCSSVFVAFLRTPQGF